MLLYKYKKIFVIFYNALIMKKSKSEQGKSQEKSQQGEFGYNGEYWMTYVGLVDLVLKFHYAISRNDFDLRLTVWEEMLPFCFVFNNVHYARYGTYYVNQMKRLEETHPGATSEIKGYGLSEHRNDFGMRQAVDLAGE